MANTATDKATIKTGLKNLGYLTGQQTDIAVAKKAFYDDYMDKSGSKPIDQVDDASFAGAVTRIDGAMKLMMADGYKDTMDENDPTFDPMHLVNQFPGLLFHKDLRQKMFDYAKQSSLYQKLGTFKSTAGKLAGKVVFVPEEVKSAKAAKAAKINAEELSHKYNASVKQIAEPLKGTNKKIADLEELSEVLKTNALPATSKYTKLGTKTENAVKKAAPMLKANIKLGENALKEAKTWQVEAKKVVTEITEQLADLEKSNKVIFKELKTAEGDLSKAQKELKKLTKGSPAFRAEQTAVGKLQKEYNRLSALAKDPQTTIRVTEKLLEKAKTTAKDAKTLKKQLKADLEIAKNISTKFSAGATNAAQAAKGQFITPVPTTAAGKAALAAQTAAAQKAAQTALIINPAMKAAIDASKIAIKSADEATAALKTLGIIAGHYKTNPTTYRVPQSQAIIEAQKAVTKAMQEVGSARVLAHVASQTAGRGQGRAGRVVTGLTMKVGTATSDVTRLQKDVATAKTLAKDAKMLAEQATGALKTSLTSAAKAEQKTLEAVEKKFLASQTGLAKLQTDLDAAVEAQKIATTMNSEAKTALSEIKAKETSLLAEIKPTYSISTQTPLSAAEAKVKNLDGNLKMAKAVLKQLTSSSSPAPARLQTAQTKVTTLATELNDARKAVTQMAGTVVPTAPLSRYQSISARVFNNLS